MKSILKAVMVAGLAVLPFTASAQIVIDPFFGENGNFAYNVCDLNGGTPAPLCPAPGVLTGPTTFTVTVLSNGTIGSSGSTSVQPSAGGSFTVFSYQVFDFTADPGHTTVLATGTPQNPADLPVIAGHVYDFVVSWTLNSVDLDSANWQVIVTSAREHKAPEPGTLALLGIALLGFGAMRLRKQG